MMFLAGVPLAWVALSEIHPGEGGNLHAILGGGYEEDVDTGDSWRDGVSPLLFFSFA